MKRKYLLKSLLTTTFVVLLFSLTVNAQQKKKTEVIEIKTSAVCGMCKEKIETNMAFEKGVKDVTLDYKTKICTIRYNPSKTNPEKLRIAITKLGYDADDKTADPKAYDKLSPCCKKDSKVHGNQ